MLSRYMTNLSAVSACLDADVPVFLWGPPGSGKSSSVRRVAEERGYRLIGLIPSIFDPSDLLGLPYQSETTTRYLPPDWLAEVMEPGSGPHLIFLNELNLAPASVINACMRMVLERAVHTFRMPPDTRFVAAGNDPDTVPTAQYLSVPMSNRFAHIEWGEGLTGPDLSAAEQAGFPVPPQRSPVDKNWAPIAAAFVGARPEMANDLGKGGRKAAAEGRGYPTSRSWDALCRALPFAGGDKDTERVLSEGIIGKAASREFMAYVRTADLIDPKEWLADPQLAQPLEGDDRTIAALLAVTAEAGVEPVTADKCAAALEVICRVAEISDRRSLCSPALFAIVSPVRKFMDREKKPPRLDEALRRMNTVFASTLHLIGHFRQAAVREEA